MSRSELGAVALATVFVAAGLIHCSLGPDQCIRMSDCESPFVCVEGTCRTNESLTSSDSEGGVTEAGATTGDTATDQ